MKKTLLVALVVGFSTLLANADVIATHSGTANPTTEGWTQHSGGTYTIYGKPDDTDGILTNVACWHISAPNYGSASYSYDIAGVDLSNGWEYTLNMRSWANSGIFGTWFAVQDGSDSFSVYFEGNDTIKLWFQGSSAYPQTIKTNADLTVYNQFKMYLNPNTNDVHVMMNDEHLATWARSAAPDVTATKLYWGNGASGSIGNMRVANVTFETVPEPATMGLLGIGGLAALIRKRR